MRRREVLAGLGALGVFGAGAATIYGDFDPLDGDEQREPISLPRLDAPGSSPGVETIPEPGRVTYLSLFATWCGTCATKMEPLGEAASLVADDVQFVSVTNEPLGHTTDEQDVVEWWDAHDGNWPVAHDEDLELSRTVDASGVPHSVTFDAENRLVSSVGGYKTVDEILDAIEEAR